jgi:hypothetical protein
LFISLSSLLLFICLSWFVLFCVVKITRLHAFSSMLWCPLRFPRKNVHVLFMFFWVLFTYIGVQRDCQMILVSFSSNTTGVTSGAGTANSSGAPEFTLGFKWGPCYSIFSFICIFCRLFLY